MSARKGREYRRVREEDDDFTVDSTASSPCLLPCIFLLLILLAFSLGLLFLLTAPRRHALLNPTTTTTTPASTTDTSTTTVRTPSASNNETHFGEDANLRDGLLDESDLSNKTYSINGTHFNISELLSEREKLVKAIREATSYLERVTGVQAELVIPLCMLILFLTAVSFVSCCCCIISRRREQRRRELFGKIITDLQAGDTSKRNLLNHSDPED